MCDLQPLSIIDSFPSKQTTKGGQPQRLYLFPVISDVYRKWLTNEMQLSHALLNNRLILEFRHVEICRIVCLRKWLSIVEVTALPDILPCLLLRSLYYNHLQINNKPWDCITVTQHFLSPTPNHPPTPPWERNWSTVCACYVNSHDHNPVVSCFSAGLYHWWNRKGMASCAKKVQIKHMQASILFRMAQV